MRHLALLTTSFFLASCSTLPRQMREDLRLFQTKAPAAWTAAHPLSTEEATDWVSSFASPLLSQQVQQALAESPDLKRTAARVRELQALAKVAGAPLLPSVDVSGNASRSQRPSGTRFESLGNIANRFQTELNVRWELDFWGRNRDTRDASLTQTQAASEDYYAARLSLSANVVKASLSVLELSQQAELSAQNVQVLQQQVTLLDQQAARGINADRSALDLSLAKADLARARATEAARKREADGVKRSLEVLLGSYPSGKASGPAAVPSLKHHLSVGVPSQLLLRRPDIRAAERRMQSAVHDESAAKKAFLPSFQISGSQGYSAQFLADLLSKQSLLWTAASSIAQPVLSQGRISGNIQAANARYDQALQNYQQTALTAFREVETALAADAYWAEQVQALEDAVKHAEQAKLLAIQSYERGLSEMLTLLDSTSRSFDAKTALLTARIAQLRNRADLHLALGGDR